MKSYSLDLRQNLPARQRHMGEVAPTPRRGEPARRLDVAAEALIRQWMQEQPDRTLAELRDRLAAATGQRVSLPTLCRVLQRLRLPRKKKSVHTTERESERVRRARAQYRQHVSPLRPDRLTLVDESGVNIAMTRLFGRVSRGVRVPDAVPNNHGCNVTILAALSCHSLSAVMTVEGPTDAAVFRAYVD